MMKKAIFGFMVACALAWAQAPALADEPSTGNYARMWRVDVEPGQFGKFMQAFKAHVDWRRANGDPWNWITHQAVTGNQFNSIWVRSGNHTLAEMDAYADFDAKASQHWSENVDQYATGYASWITETDPEVRNWPDDLQPSMIQAYTYHVKPGQGEAFDAALKEIHQGLEKAKWGEHYAVSRVVSGAPGNQVTLVLPYMSYADMADPETPFPAALAKAYGEQKATKLMKAFSDTYSQVDEILVRVDMENSLVAAAR